MSTCSRTLVFLCIVQAAFVTVAADERVIRKRITMEVAADGKVSPEAESLYEDMEVNAQVSNLMEEVEEMARSGVTPQPDKITIIKNIVNNELLPDLKATRQSSVDQIATNLAAIETCNKHGVETQQNIASSTEVQVGSARSTHTACRTEEKNKKSTKETRCKELDDFLNDVAVPATMPSPKKRDQMVPYVQKMSSYFCPKGPTVTKLNEACKTAEKEHEAHKASCDKKQAVFEMAFCQWRTRLTDTCTTLDQCYNGALATHTQFVEVTKVLEKKWKLEYSSLKKIVCYTGVWLTDNKVSSENLQKCASSTIDTSPMNIVYPDVPKQAQCSTAKVDIYPGSTAFPNKEYKDFLDFAVAVIPCVGPGPAPAPPTTIAPPTIKPSNSEYSELKAAQFTGWDNNQGTKAGSHYLHGPFGTKVAIKKTLEKLSAHTEVTVSFRYWALDSWDREWGNFYADGKLLWKKQREDPRSCKGWKNNNNNHLGYDVVDPWGGNNNQDCYEDVEFKFAHTGANLELKFDSSINQNKNDEAWAVEMIVVKFSTPKHFGTEYSEVGAGKFSVWDNYGTNVGSHFIHGPFGSKVAIKKTLENLDKHTKIKVSFRYWALDSWDREWGNFYADGKVQWKKQRTDPYGCSGWKNNNNNHLGYDVIDPWRGNNNQDCYEDVDITFAHTGDKLELKFDSSINQKVHDEAWAVEMVVVKLLY